MKLWVKLSVLLVIVINLVVEVGLQYVAPKVEDFSVDLVGEKLKSIAASISASIDGEEFKKINIFDSSSVNSESYKNIMQTIQKAKERLELSEELYSITILDKNSLSFGVVLNRLSGTEENLQEISQIAREIVSKVYKTHKCEYSPMYIDRYGNWLSGFAPIFDPDKKVIGVVQVDQRFEQVIDRIDEINSSIQLSRLYSIPFTIILSVILSVVFVRPIRDVKNKISRIASGNYESVKDINAGGEVGELVEAAENLRRTILEQQEKIFQNIKELESARDKAEASDRLKSEFLAVISHEIRTPLNVILGNIEILKLELDEDKIQELEDILEPIKFGSERLIRTVEMLVLYSELSSNSYVKREKYVDANNLFFTSLEVHKKAAINKGLKINFDCATTTGMIKADERLLEEAINQLAGNAVKFTDGGEITFCIKKNEDDSIILIFNDTGIGISEEFKKDLLKPFHQEDMSYERKFEGNGIGLALAKKCCDLCGFELRIESEKNKGTKAEIIIPKEYLFNEG